MNTNEQYQALVQHILLNQEFQKLNNIEHHGTTRLMHSMRVSYVSYKVAKFLHLDYEQTARAGLLHDFFLSEENRSQKEKIISTFVHPKYAIDNASYYFSLSDKEKDIIESHMFPIYHKIPKYAESWIVSSVDKVVGTYEFAHKFKYQFSYVTNFILLMLLNSIVK